MTANTQRPPKTFELRAGPMPVLRPADPSTQPEPEAGAPQTSPAAGCGQGSLTPRDVILRLVETVKAL